MLWVGAITSGVFLITFPYDEGVRNFVQTHKNVYADIYFKNVNYLGDGKVLVPIWFITGLYGYTKKDTSILNLSKSGLLGFTSAGIITVALKYIFGRARPYMNLGSKEFRPFNLDDKFHSLPSGHTSVSFSAAGVIWRRTNNDILRYSSLLLASSVGLARIYLDKHYLSDVVLGAGIGFICGYISAGFIK